MLGVSSVIIAKENNPNIIFILTDDQGYGDLSCHGNPYLHTPNIDKLESMSYSFSDFHSGTTSAPTRSGLMTGKYGNSTGVWHTVQGRSLLSLDLVTIPELMKKGGYTTGMFGKWHLGDYFPYYPHNRGFDVALYHGGGGVGQGPDYWNNRFYDDTYFKNGKIEKTDGYCTDVWFDNAIRFMDDCGDNPFFVYLATNAPHGPWYVEDKYKEEFYGNENIINPAFYGSIVAIDENIGKLISHLETKGQLDNTIIIFMTDNGATGGGSSKIDKNGYVVRGYNAGMRGLKSSVYEGGHRVPFMVKVPGHTPKKINTLSGYIDVMPTILELAGLGNLVPDDIDGQSLVPLFKEDNDSERFMIVDTQRDDFLEKYKNYCVMYKKWRLVNGKELYDISTDLEQRKNVITNHPELVYKMKGEYEKWWNESSMERAGRYERIWVGHPDCSEVLLYSHDLHGVDKVAFDQKQIISGMIGKPGFWAIDVVKAGKYKIRLYRWPPYINLPIKSPTSYNKRFLCEIPAGKAMTGITEAEVLIDNTSYARKTVNDNMSYVEFIVFLNKGECFLQTDFIMDDKRFSSYYTLIEPY